MINCARIILCSLKFGKCKRGFQGNTATASLPDLNYKLSVYPCASVVSFLCMLGGKLIYLSLGSNLGDRAENLERAIAALPQAGVLVLRRSSLYETEPVDFLAQPWFLNCGVEVETWLMRRHFVEGL